MTIGESAKKAREKAGLTRRQLAEKANYDYMTLYYFEEGLRFPKITTVIDFANILTISLDEYIGRNLQNHNKTRKE